MLHNELFDKYVPGVGEQGIHKYKGSLTFFNLGWLQFALFCNTQRDLVAIFT
jgi:hypothetical protein